MRSETFVQCVKVKIFDKPDVIRLSNELRNFEQRNTTMVDTRSAGAFGIAGALNFKSGDISGTAAKTADDRSYRGTEYFRQNNNNDDDRNGMFGNDRYMDRSAQLRATLNSLALMNVAGIIKSNKPF